MTYYEDPETAQRLAREFTYHAPFGDQSQRYEGIRYLAGELGRELLGLCPSSHELEVALDRLNEVVFWANASIARHEFPHPDISQTPTPALSNLGALAPMAASAIVNSQDTEQRDQVETAGEVVARRHPEVRDYEFQGGREGP